MSLTRSFLPARAIAAGLMLALAGCGIVYQSPSVTRMTSDGSKVQVVPITAESLLVANRSPYTPRSLPTALAQTGGLPTNIVGPITAPQRLQTRLPPPVKPGPYKIGVGDVLLLATQAGSTVAELSGLLAAENSRQGYTVQDDGAIAIPNVGRVQVAGKTVQDAEAAVFQALVAHNIDPTFSLEISQFGSQKVTVGGAVGAARVEPITLQQLHLDEALSGAGGIQVPNRDTASVRIYRKGQIYQIPLKDYYDQPALQHLPLLDGDSVFVDTQYNLAGAQAYFSQQLALAQFRQAAQTNALSQLSTEAGLDSVKRDYVYLAGEVGSQTRYALPFGHTASLADALYGEGKGVPTQTGNVSQIYVLRSSPDPREFGAVTAWNLNAKNAANLVLAARFQLRPDDVIFVAEQPITRWNRVLQQIIPSITTTKNLANN